MKIAEKIHRAIDNAWKPTHFEQPFKLVDIASRLRDLESHQYEKIDSVLFCTYEDFSQLQIDYALGTVQAIEKAKFNYESAIDPENMDKGNKYKVARYEDGSCYAVTAWLLESPLTEDFVVYEFGGMDSESEALTAQSILYDILEGNYKK